MRSRQISGIVILSLFAAILQVLPLTVAPASAAASQSVGLNYLKTSADKLLKINLGALATRSQGADITRSTLSTPWTITGTDSNGAKYSELTSGNRITSTYDPATYAAWGYESKNVTSTKYQSATYKYLSNNDFYTDTSGRRLSGTAVLISGTTFTFNNTCAGHACFGSVFGAQLYSNTFSITAGQGASFLWAARGMNLVNDPNGCNVAEGCSRIPSDYEMYAFLVKLSGSACTASDTGFGSDIDNSLFVHSRGGKQDWTSTSAKISSSGCYRLRFVFGVYDTNGRSAPKSNQLLESKFWINSVRVNAAQQTISFNTPADIIAADASAADASDFTATASTNATGNSVTFTSRTPTICTVTSSGVVDVKANDPTTPRNCTLVASAANFGDYIPANDVVRTFQIKTTASKPIYSGWAELSGSGSVCNTLTVDQGMWNTGGASYLQEITYFDFNGADTITASSRTLTTGDVGKSIRAIIVKQNSFGWETATTASVLVADATLSAIASSDGTFAPTFATCQTSYALSTESSTITITPTAAGSTITVNGTSVSSGSATGAISLAVGSNSITVISTKSSVTFTVTLAITRTVSSSPSVSPTPAPVISPTPAPVVSPTPAPVVSPTPAPVCEPTRISDISPAVIPVVGGTYVTVNGNGLTDSVYVDNSPVNVPSKSGSQKIIFVAPAHAKGVVEVRINGCSGSSTIKIEYDSSPRVLSYTPDNGSSLGGTTVVITGTQLANSSAIVGGAVAALLSNNEGNLTLTTPRGTPGTTNIVITTGYGLVNLPFTYYAAPEFLAFTPPYIQQGESIEFSIGSKFADSVELHSGQLPPGLSFTSALGTITGAPTKAGIYNFKLIAKGKGGQVINDFQLEVDKVIPDDIYLTMQLDFNEIKPSGIWNSNLQNFMKLAQELTPKKFKPLIYIEGGAQTTIKYPIVDELGKLRHAFILDQASAFGVPLSKTISNYCLGYDDTIKMTISWKKMPSDFAACENRSLKAPNPSSQPEKEPKVLALKVYFPMGSEMVTTSEQLKIKTFARRIQDLGAAIQVFVNGFAQPTKGTELSDLKLSEARAVQVADFLENLGVGGIVEVAGKGRTNLNDASSRYVEIVVKTTPK
jgi:hypothetical protein